MKEQYKKTHLDQKVGLCRCLLLAALCSSLLFASPVAAQEGEGTLAEPERALDIPAIPEMLPVGSLAIPSAEEENDAYLKNSDEWKDVKTFYESAKKEEAVDKGLQIRFTLLPDARVIAAAPRPISPPDVKEKATSAAAQAAKSVKEKKIEASPEACQALADMRRRQLEAIESDRKTLSELRKALAELGVSDQLNFMPKTSESVSTEKSDGTETPGQLNPTKIQ